MSIAVSPRVFSLPYASPNPHSNNFLKANPNPNSNPNLNLYTKPNLCHNSNVFHKAKSNANFSSNLTFNLNLSPNLKPNPKIVSSLNLHSNFCPCLHTTFKSSLYITTFTTNLSFSPTLFSPSPKTNRKRHGVHMSAMADKPIGILGRLGKVFKEKAKADFDRVFKGVKKTRESLAVVDELLSYWNLSDSEGLLDELEEALLIADFGPRTSLKLVDVIRKEVGEGKLKNGLQIKLALKREILKLLTEKVPTTELQLPESRPAVIMIVGVNGGGKTTTLGKLAHRFQGEGMKVLMAAGDTFRAAAREQLEVWAKRTDSQFVGAEGEKSRPSTVLVQGVRKAIEMGVDVVLADTSGRLHTNDRLMSELRGCKKSIEKLLPGAPHEILMVLDGTTGLNMLPQAREFNQVMGVTGFVLTKLDGTSRGGCVASVVDELGIPVKFVGVGEGIEDLQPFDAESFVNALFPT